MALVRNDVSKEYIFLRSVLQLLVIDNVIIDLLSLSTLIMEAICSSEMAVLRTAALIHIPEDVAFFRVTAVKTLNLTTLIFITHKVVFLGPSFTSLGDRVPIFTSSGNRVTQMCLLLVTSYNSDILTSLNVGVTSHAGALYYTGFTASGGKVMN